MNSSSAEDVFTRWTPLTCKVATSMRYGRRSFPTRDDYEAALVSAGQAASAPAVWRDPSLVAAIQRHWHTTGQNGCLFARRLAMRPGHDDWEVAMLDVTRGDFDSTATEAIEAGRALPNVQIVSLLLPGVSDGPTLKRAIERLGKDVFSVEEEVLGKEVLLALRRPVTDEGALAWVMGFGPFASLPPTRQAPVTELAVRVKPKPPSLHPALNHDPHAAHLADSPTGLTREQTGLLVERTKKATGNVLGEPADERSAARTTFSFPADEWASH